MQPNLVSSFQELGLTPGIGVIVHSSLRSFGYVEGGAHTIIEALMHTITPDGTLIMPSFNHGEPFEEDGPGYYDPLTTPTSNGAIPDAFWRMPHVQRSLNPTHPFAAWGKHAQRYVQHHHRTLTMGSESPLGLLYADGGYGLLLGVDYVSNTFHHVVETLVHSPCLGRRTEAYPVQHPDGRRVPGRTWSWRNDACPITDHNRYGPEMAARGLHRQMMIGPCQATLFKLQDCFTVVADLLQNGLGQFPPCTRCPIRPRINKRTVPSDWDAETQSLKADSMAWTY